MTYFKSTFFSFLIIIMSSNIIGDERAPRSQCYINGGWTFEANIGQKIRELNVRPESLEIYIRSDKQIYLTLGKIDRDLWKKVKSSLNSSYSCSSGKGYQKRVFVNNDYSSLSSETSTKAPKGRVINSDSELISLIKPTLSAYIAEADRLAEQKRLDAEEERANAARLYKEKERSEQKKQAVVEKDSLLSTPSLEMGRVEENVDESATFWSQGWKFILGLFVLSWIYKKYANRKIRMEKAAEQKRQAKEKEIEDEKKRQAKEKAAEESRQAKEKAAEESRQAKEKAAEENRQRIIKQKKRSDTLKSFQNDYPNLSLSRLEKDCDIYLGTESNEEQSRIRDNLKELDDEKLKEIENSKAELAAKLAEERAKQKAEYAEKQARFKEEDKRREARRKKEQARQEAARIKKLELLEKDYGEQVAKAFASKKVAIGMPISYVKEIKGEGHDRKRNVSKDGEVIKEKYGKYYKSLTGGKKSSNPSYKMEIEYERNEAGNSWLVVSYKDY